MVLNFSEIQGGWTKIDGKEGEDEKEDEKYAKIIYPNNFFFFYKINLYLHSLYLLRLVNNELSIILSK